MGNNMDARKRGPFTTVDELRSLRRELLDLANKYPDYLGDRDHVGLVEKSFNEFIRDLNNYLLAAEDALK